MNCFYIWVNTKPVFIDWNAGYNNPHRKEYDHMIYYLGNHRWIQISESAKSLIPLRPTGQVIIINAQSPGQYTYQWNRLIEYKDYRWYHKRWNWAGLIRFIYENGGYN